MDRQTLRDWALFYPVLNKAGVLSGRCVRLSGRARKVAARSATQRAPARRSGRPGRGAQSPPGRTAASSARWEGRVSSMSTGLDQRYEQPPISFPARSLGRCPARGTGAVALALPYADTFAMQLHLGRDIRQVAMGAHAVLLLDRAGWRTTTKLRMPKDVAPIFLPSRAPELNPV